MEKKAYIKPELDVIMMTEQASILAGSGEASKVVFSEDAAEEGNAWSAGQTSLWDDTDE